MIETYKEEYILTVRDVALETTEVINIPNRKQLAQIIDNLTDRFAISTLVVVINAQSGKDFLEDLKDKNKPDDLIFGCGLRI